MKSPYFRWLQRTALGVATLALVLGFALACTFVYLAPALPTAATMRNKELALPLQVLTRDGKLVSQFGEERRIAVRFEDIPLVVRQAVLAAEDDRFFQHHGLDWMGLVRALVTNVTSGGANQGGSTITQQTVKYMYLTLDKTLRRKASEVFLTYRMEHDFTKEQILAAYLNIIPYGQRSSGIAAAAETYYGKRLKDLTVAQAATLAGISQRPSRQNPISYPKAAEARRAYVLRRMTELGYIDAATATAAAREPVASRGFALLNDVEADYVAELARQQVVARFGEQAINAGYKAFTTLDASKQTAANSAVRLNLLDFDQRHGYRGRLGKVELSSAPTAEELEDRLEKFRPVNMLQPAIVTRVAENGAEVYVREQGAKRIEWEGLSWAARSVTNGVGRAPKAAADVLKRGDVIYIIPGEHGSVRLSQMPQAQAALVALDPKDGAILALVGGFDFYNSAFNRVTQAHRQPGSGFKPILYSAALENGLTAASIIYDMPVITDSSSSSEDKWKPENSGGDWKGPMRLREALVLSRNAVSIRILQDIGLDAAINHAAKFGFDPKSLPRDQTLALGTQSATPLQMATAYTVFANGGFKVNSYLITRIEDGNGKVVFEAKPTIACPACEVPEGADSDSVPVDRRAPRVVSAQNVWLMSDIMHDVATRGTGKRTQELGRDDLAGKTGTTDQPVRDNWFNGFNSNLVATAWVGFDDERPLGEREEGSSTAVPMWNLFMREALRGAPSARMQRPDGIIVQTISSTSGAPTSADDPSAITEFFLADHESGQPATTTEGTPTGTPAGTPAPSSPKPGKTAGSEPVLF